MSKYITPEEYALAEENDIPARVLYARINYHHWSKEDALYYAPGKRRKGVQYGAVAATDDKWYYIAKENDISPQTYHKRRKRGWSPERAATTPAIRKFHPKHKPKPKPKEKIKLTEADYRVAESNGISRKMAYTRVNVNDWTIERAITQKPRPKAPNGEGKEQWSLSGT